MASLLPLLMVALPVPYDPNVMGDAASPAQVQYSRVPEKVWPPWNRMVSPG